MSGQLQTSPTCPCCHATLDGFSHVDSEAPDAGDYSICAYCLTSLVFDGDPLTLRRPTEAEGIAMGADPDFQAALGMLKRAHEAGQLQPREPRQ